MTACDSILSELGAVESASSSINGKLDQVLSRLSALENRLDGIENTVGSITSVINNSIDSLENVLINAINGILSTIQSLFQSLIDLIRSIFGQSPNDRTDEILSRLTEIGVLIIDGLQAINRGLGLYFNQTNSRIDDLGNLVIDGLQVINRGLGLYFNETNSKIDSCCDGLSSTLNIILNCLPCDDSSISDVIERIDRVNDQIQDTVRRENDENEGKIDRVLDKLGGTDWIGLLNSILNIVLLLRNREECDVSDVIERVDSCCASLSNLIVRIDYNSQFSSISSKIDSNSATLNTINSTTSTTSSTVNNISNQISTLNLSTENITNNIQNITNRFENITNNIENVTNQIGDTTNNTNLINNVDQVLNRVINIQDTIDNTPPGSVDLELEQIRVPVFVRCNADGVPEFDDKDILVLKTIKDAELLKYQKLAEIEAIKCKPAVAVVPEWWQVRLEGGIPQFVIAFGEVNADSGKCTHAKYSMTIPHFKNVKPLNCPVPRYKKGNYELIAYFSDNSKIIINAVSEAECERVYNLILPWIEPSWLEGLKYKVGKRVSYPFKEIWVCPRFGRYFSLGNRELNPDWTVYFN